ncbi:DedA family protein [Oscillospiraceae bacterium MB08-C2-2]|nr:DedA family protein [Oscillospiraceae bacterium MB08-C2-2]
MQEIVQSMEQWVLWMVEAYGYLGITFLIAVENVFPPIPSEIILAFGGFMTTRTTMSVPGVIVWATVGSVVGALILYGLGRWLGRERFEALVHKFGKPLGVKMSDIEKTYAWFEKYETKTVFFCRMVPIVRSLISIPAGITKMQMGSFLVFTTVGSVIWNTILVVAGSILGEAWESILDYFSAYSTGALWFFIVVAIGVVAFFLWRKSRQK